MFAFPDGTKRFLINSNCYSAASCCSMQKCLIVMVTHYLLTVDSVKMVSLRAIDSGGEGNFEQSRSEGQDV